MPQDNFLDDLIQELYGEQPELALFGQAQQAGRGKNFERFFQKNSGDFLNRFKAAIGGQLAQGQLPTIKPEDFFNNDFLTQSYYQTTPESRGLGTSQLVPRTRYLNF